MKDRLKKILCFVLGRNWVVPVVALLGSALVAIGTGVLSIETRSAGVAARVALGHAVDVGLLSQMLLLLGLPVWLLAFTVRRLIRKQRGVGWAWLWSMLAGVGMLFCLLFSALSVSFGDYDTFAQEHRLPDDMTPENTPGMAVPLGFSFYTLEEQQMPPAVKKWKDLVHVDSSMCISGDEQLSESAPNVEKLASEAPELLLEYKLRALCHRALTPGVKLVPHLELLRHVFEHAGGEEDDSLRYDADDVIWLKPLQNGWKIYTRRSRFFGEEVPWPFALKKLQQLNEGLTALAATPTREGLDALLPPLPDKPVIVLREGFQPGMYIAILVVPRDYPEGTFQVRAKEYTRGTELSTRGLENINFAPQPYRNFCKLAVSEKIMVYSGEWGEFYASTWELYFTPASGGEPRCVNSQLYLMQGWTR